ncbi:dihydroxyacetone kinase phosphoryl donor subunit DhaM [Schaalia hyovaginalis]|uniref:dihydroxyacetone kinase phosphoryl donor subunit DhaM n=1 Tax=Schaalia hyovaginalis TaxID=29316 RepID=UPI002A75807A|nr:dihydroxyacetone kinase phosphoryl donor subunit DhaM [Schaalia hyovaginalis]MDY2668620.1 dihydroxyacetone kinase phosphoryl donor subunit DhaM [Schaalia hyovaginalis]
MMPRVAFVIASHSERLAQGVVELAAQMAPEVHFGAAGGTDEGGIGTSYEKIEAAVEAALEVVGADEGNGVVILTDLGSATMTVESVLDFADDPEHLVFVDAPLVEGAIAAAVRAQLGDPLAQVVAAARSAFALAPEDMPVPSPVAAPLAEGGGECLSARALVADPVGLHARPAALLARLAGAFDAEVTINDADAGSVLELMALGVKQGETVELKACGPDAREALDALVEAIETAE